MSNPYELTYRDVVKYGVCFLRNNIRKKVFSKSFDRIVRYVK